jgi:hypothetical protein
MTEIDDETVAYIIEQRRYFEDLRQIAAQLAGLLVLSASGARSATPDHPMLESAEQLFHEAADGVRRARAPVRARPHHHHLLQALSGLGSALLESRRRFACADAAEGLDCVMGPLRAGYAHLQEAANALPGFELIAFDQGCCAIQGSPCGHVAGDKRSREAPGARRAEAGGPRRH